MTTNLLPVHSAPLLDRTQDAKSSRPELLFVAEAEALHPSVTSKLKRVIDILGASVGLLMTMLIAVPIAIAIQLDNPGPILYSQVRCGVKGRTFRIWKFRSMVANADQLKHLVKNEAKGNIFKSKEDPRITGVGKFLRRTSLDELPQFWNVLCGDMSLVGTRPPTVDEVKRYESHHWKRLDVKPGITGEWQANGRSNVSDFEDIVAMDLEYQRRWSIAYDLKLIFQTIWVVFNKHGAC
jgi:lipopolysaccharide/colanic/teichoic acid biosynthesis glycosyltransferase